MFGYKEAHRTDHDCHLERFVFIVLKETGMPCHARPCRKALKLVRRKMGQGDSMGRRLYHCFYWKNKARQSKQSLNWLV